MHFSTVTCFYSLQLVVFKLLIICFWIKWTDTQTRISGWDENRCVYLYCVYMIEDNDNELWPVSVAIIALWFHSFHWYIYIYIFTNAICIMLSTLHTVVCALWLGIWTFSGLVSTQHSVLHWRAKTWQKASVCIWIHTLLNFYFLLSTLAEIFTNAICIMLSTLHTVVCAL